MGDVKFFLLGLGVATIFIALFWKQLRYRRERMLAMIKDLFNKK